MNNIDPYDNEAKFISVKSAMEIFSLSRTTIYWLRKKNKIKWYAVEIPSQEYRRQMSSNPKVKVLILRKSLEQYLETFANTLD